MADQDKTAEKEFFDHFDVAGGYDRFGEHGYRHLISEFRAAVCPAEGETVLDMGCGSGAFTVRLYRAFPKLKLTGVDISSGCIARAAKEYPMIDFQVGDAENSECPAGSVDILCYSGILHHFPNFETLATEAFRLLKPGGRFFSYDPHLYNPAFWLYRSKSSPFYSPIGVTSNERLMTAGEVRRVFSAAGFRVSVHVISGITFANVESKRARALLGIYNLLDRILGATPLARVIGAWVIGSGVRER